MPYHVAKSSRCEKSKPYAVINTATGKIMGCHDTKDDALKQQAALYANEPSLKSLDHLMVTPNPNRSEIERAKLAKDDVHYGLGKGTTVCANCQHFLAGGTCSVVAGKIAPDAWCDRFDALPKREDAPFNPMTRSVRDDRFTGRPWRPE